MAAMDISALLKTIQIPTTRRYVSVRPVEGEFMHRWVKEHGLSRTLEVGLAYGASASCIMSAHEGTHTCMDPFQGSLRQPGIGEPGILGISRAAGFPSGSSHDVLPQLRRRQANVRFRLHRRQPSVRRDFVDFFYVDLPPAGSRLRAVSRRLDARHATGRFVHQAKSQGLPPRALSGEEPDPVSEDRKGRATVAAFPRVLHLEELSFRTA